MIDDIASGFLSRSMRGNISSLIASLTVSVMRLDYSFVNRRNLVFGGNFTLDKLILERKTSDRASFHASISSGVL